MSVLGLRVDSKDYEFYRDELLRREKEYVLSVLRATFKQLIEELRRKRGAVGAPSAPSEAQREIVLRIEQVQRVEESEVLKLYRRIQHLERELSRALASLEEAKDQLERERSERQRCAQELESMKRRPEELQKELQRLEQSYAELLGLAALARYCLDTQECDLVKLRDLLRTRLGKLGVEHARPSDVLLSLVRKLPK